MRDWRWLLRLVSAFLGMALAVHEMVKLPRISGSWIDIYMRGQIVDVEEDLGRGNRRLGGLLYDQLNVWK